VTSSTGETFPRVVYYLEEVMGTVVVFDLYVESTIDGEVIDSLVERARSSLHHADDLFSTWKTESAVSKLRRGVATLDDMPEDVRDVLTLCASARDVSQGWFNPWAMPGGVDPTGYVKGWAAQRALRAFDHDGIVGAMVNAAGDIATRGRPGVNAPFRIGVTDPGAHGRLACVVDVHAAIATSGTYERGQHLIDPFSGRSGARAASASVVGPDLGIADALATALAVAGREFLELLEDVPDYEGLAFESDGSWSCTTRFPFAANTLPANPVTAKRDLHRARK
jgi:thiamine biosynthesis lipoprotein